MIYYFLLILSIILAVCKSSIYNTYAKKDAPTLVGTFRFNAISYGCAAIIALIGMLVSAETLSGTTVICAFFYATIVVSLQTISITAMSVGAMSTTSICVMYGMIIPAVAGPIFWHEPIGVLQIIGIVAMIFSLWLIKGEKPTDQKGMTRKWAILAIFAFILSGMAGVMEKIHQSTSANDERMSFVCVACTFMFVFSIAAILMVRKKEDKKTIVSVIPLAALSGLVVGFYSTVNLILAGKLESIIYYPVANGGAMLLTVLVSVIAFKERFDKWRMIGTAIGLIGILCLSIPI